MSSTAMTSELICSQPGSAEWMSKLCIVYQWPVTFRMLPSFG